MIEREALRCAKNIFRQTLKTVGKLACLFLDSVACGLAAFLAGVFDAGDVLRAPGCCAMLRASGGYSAREVCAAFTSEMALDVEKNRDDYTERHPSRRLRWS